MSERFTRMRERCLAALVAAGLAAVLLVATGSGAAQPRPLSQDETAVEPLTPAQRDQLFPAQQGGISLEQATAMARSRFPGRVVRAATVKMGDRVVHEIRIVDAEGVVRNVRIDAQTGAFL